MKMFFCLICKNIGEIEENNMRESLETSGIVGASTEIIANKTNLMLNTQFINL